MKNFLIYDTFENSELVSQEDLKKYLVEELIENILTNLEDKEFVRPVIYQLGDLANNKKVDNIIQELNNYGWYVNDLFDLQKQLSDYQAFKHGVGAPSYPNDCIEQTLKMIEEDMK